MRLVLFTSVAALVAIGAARAAELSEREVADARKLYNAKCAKCHKFYDPAKYSEEEWHMWMFKMSKKAKLKPAQADLLGRYLEAYRNGTGTNSTSTARRSGNR